MSNANRKILMITPVPVPAAAHPLFEGQVPENIVRDTTSLVFAFAREGGTSLDSWYDDALAAAFILESACKAEEQGFDGVCICTMTDTGLDAVRSRLSIPVVSAGESALLTACALGSRISIVTLWDRWSAAYRKVLSRQGISGRLASIRHIDTRPDLEELLTGKEDVVFEALEKAANLAIEEDGADVIVLGSTTMYQSHQYLASRLPVPVVNPALAVYLQCETLLDLGVAHSKRTWPAPEVLNDDLFKAVPARFE